MFTLLDWLSRHGLIAHYTSEGEYPDHWYEFPHILTIYIPAGVYVDGFLFVRDAEFWWFPKSQYHRIEPAQSAQVCEYPCLCDDFVPDMCVFCDDEHHCPWAYREDARIFQEDYISDQWTN